MYIKHTHTDHVNDCVIHCHTMHHDARQFTIHTTETNHASDHDHDIPHDHDHDIIDEQLFVRCNRCETIIHASEINTKLTRIKHDRIKYMVTCPVCELSHIFDVNVNNVNGGYDDQTKI